MDISKILLVCILCILVILILNRYFKNEFLNNNLPNNNIVAQGDNNLLIPTSDQVYNPNDLNRPNNNLSHQETNILNNNENIDEVNTDSNIPLVYSHDEITETTINRKPKHNPPSYIRKIIDTGSGNIGKPIKINNNVLNKLRSIE
jgi:hypothetical protein